MNLWFALAPWWVRAPAYSVLFFGLWALFTTAVDPRPDWVQCVVIAAMLGIARGITSAQRNRREVAPLLAEVALRDYRQVSKALWGGPPPSNPVILHATAHLAHLRYAQSVNGRKYSVLSAVAGVVVLIAFGDSHTLNPAGYAMATLFITAAVHACINPPRLRARAAFLTETARQTPLPPGLSDTVPPSEAKQIY
ncbi:hypothetical protein BKG86_01750 [Mycobacteroides chelonae]|nr:hypothetical protein BKG86_01750 [Mycobacteroides chelonae]